MDVEGLRRAIAAAPRTGLDALAKDVCAAWDAGRLSDDDASDLWSRVAARRAPPAPAPAAAPRRTGSRPRSPASVERRRMWSAGGWMPPAIQARFTGGEAAALAVVLHEIARSGRCALPVGAIAGRAGICATTVRNALREAVRLRLVAVEERRVAYDRSLPNLITIVSRDLALWVRTRARVEARGGWVQDSDADPQPSLNLSWSSAAPAARDLACRGAEGTGSAPPRPRLLAITGRPITGHLGARWSGFQDRRVS